MKKYGVKRSRGRNIFSWVLSLAMIGAGVALIASFFLAGTQSTATNSSNPSGFNVPKLQPAQDDGGLTTGPEDKTLKLTIPAMERIEDDAIPTTQGDDEEALKNSAAIHLEGTSFPWQDEANVYIAGHRLGYPNTESFLTFWDLDNVKKGDEVYITDANGTRYTYEVFKEVTVSPSELSVTEPIAGKNIVTLQTCTLPDYSQRLIVQAELIKTE
jgi:sortase A